jgi:hypothetical protein
MKRSARASSYANCPICNKCFPISKILQHADQCARKTDKAAAHVAASPSTWPLGYIFLLSPSPPPPSMAQPTHSNPFPPASKRPPDSGFAAPKAKIKPKPKPKPGVSGVKMGGMGSSMKRPGSSAPGTSAIARGEQHSVINKIDIFASVVA